MKSRFYGALATLAVALTVGVSFAQAQSRVNADVPFAFTLQDKAMPAGNYQIIARSAQVLEVRSLDSQHGQLLIKQMAVQSNKDQSPKLVFHKYGDQYFLTQIWYGDSRNGVGFAESKREKEISMASNDASSAPETVIVAMK
ncbi:MAG: hypothetical protein WBM04_13940 [Candidatus Korobacteraceae bacterium]